MSLSRFQIGPGTWVRLSYKAFDEEGGPVEAGAQELAYVHGYGILLPALEAALEGRGPAETCRVTLAPEAAFGPRRSDAVLECAPDEFPDDVQAGDRLEAENAQGGLVVLRVLEVRPDAVIVDTNHPLAGQRVAFELTVLEVRPAKSSELARAEAQLNEERPADGPLVPVQRLLRGPSQRYERPSAAPAPLAGRADDEET